MFSSERLERPNYAAARNAAIHLLKQAGVYEPPVNPVEIAGAMGVKVEFVSFSGDSTGVSGLFDCESNSILVNVEEPGVRQTFTVAHELGHKVLHEDWAKSEFYKVLWRDPNKQGKDRREQEANAFAAELLMPKSLMNEYRGLPASTLARLFAVSEAAMSHRIKFLYE